MWRKLDCCKDENYDFEADFNLERKERTGPKVINGYQWGTSLGKGTPPHQAVLVFILNVGAWGKVKRVTHLETQRECAVKVFYRALLQRKLKNGIQLLREEFQLVQSLPAHRNIVQYYELDETSNPEKIYLFLELCGGGTLETAVATIPAGPLRRHFLCDKFQQLFSALAHLQSQNVAHHDVKLDNVLLTADGMVKLCDFGVAEKFDPHVGCRVFYGTPAYQPPEIAGNTEGTPFNGFKADVWSAGVALYRLVYGRLPFEAPSVYLVLQAIEKDPVRITAIKGDPPLTDLLRELLCKDPRRRPEAKEVLLHPWFTQGVEEFSAPSSSAICCSIL